MPIQRLSPLIANQIAAGEVVERPSSVVKELLENSIDAGSNRIQVDIERGGIRLIRITDNGKGIPKEELALALARHATSKIVEAADLSAINTLGFRGEALASISSVARLTLSSKPETQEIGWSAYAEGSEMEVQLKPHPLPFGTIVEVKDLFFNTPARQKFLKAERTEFVHIEETIKRVVLANPQIALTLKHNGKVVKRVPGANSSEQIKQRIGTILGRSFIAKAIALENQIEDVALSGWVSPIDFHQSSSFSQYFFVNGRPVKDRTINHAVRQAYQDLLPTGRSSSYLLYLEVPPENVDVNVHPTKHEVRFSDPRMVHDYIIKVIATCLEGKSLQQQTDYIESDVAGQPSETVALHRQNNERRFIDDRGAAHNTVKTNYSIQDNKQNYYSPTKTNSKKSILGHLLLERFYLEQKEGQLLLLDVKEYSLQFIKDVLLKEWSSQEIKLKPLLIPIRLTINDRLHRSEISIEQLIKQWNQLGIELALAGPQSLIARRIPSSVEQTKIEAWLQQVLNNQSANSTLEQSKKNLLDALSDHWQPDAKVNWQEFLEQRNNVSPWQTSKYCRQLTENDLHKLLAS